MQFYSIEYTDHINETKEVSSKTSSKEHETIESNILAAINDIRYARCSYPPSSSSASDPCQQKHLMF